MQLMLKRKRKRKQSELKLKLYVILPIFSHYHKLDEENFRIHFAYMIAIYIEQKSWFLDSSIIVMLSHLLLKAHSVNLL